MYSPPWSTAVTEGEETVTDTGHQNNQKRGLQLTLSWTFWSKKGCLATSAGWCLGQTLFPPLNTFIRRGGGSDPKYSIFTKIRRGAGRMNAQSHSNQHPDGRVGNLHSPRATSGVFVSMLHNPTTRVWTTTLIQHMQESRDDENNLCQAHDFMPLAALLCENVLGRNGKTKELNLVSKRNSASVWPEFGARLRMGRSIDVIDVSDDETSACVTCTPC